MFRSSCACALLPLARSVAPRAAAPASAHANPIKVGVSLALTGGVASNGKQILMALELWRDDVNAKGGLLGRPVELVYYDDQSNPNNVPALYTKLISRRQGRSAARPLCHQHGRAGHAGDHAEQQDHHRLAGDRHQPALQLPEIFLHGPGRAQGTRRIFRRFLRAGGGADAEAADRGDRAADAEFAKTAADARARNATAPASGSSMTGRIRRPRPISCRSCARCRPPTPTSSSSPPIRPTPSASSARRTRSTSCPRCSAAP